MIIDCISDLHGFQPKLPGGDVLLLAGDYTASNLMTQWVTFFEWLKNQPYKNKVLIAGNHDYLFLSGFPKNQNDFNSLKTIQEFLGIDTHFEYLCDCGVNLIVNDVSIKIWGTPWTPWFHGVHPSCKAFMRSEPFLKKKFNLIPENLDILITHGPMRYVLDSNIKDEACGSISLRRAINRVQPKYHVFGHIHEQGGKEMLYSKKNKVTKCINCSYVNESYQPTHLHARIHL